MLLVGTAAKGAETPCWECIKAFFASVSLDQFSLRNFWCELSTTLCCQPTFDSWGSGSSANRTSSLSVLQLNVVRNDLGTCCRITTQNWQTSTTVVGSTALGFQQMGDPGNFWKTLCNHRLLQILVSISSSQFAATRPLGVWMMTVHHWRTCCGQLCPDKGNFRFNIGPGQNVLGLPPTMRLLQAFLQLCVFCISFSNLTNRF